MREIVLCIAFLTAFASSPAQTVSGDGVDVSTTKELSRIHPRLEDGLNVGVVDASGLRLRSGPNLTSEVTGTLTAEQIVVWRETAGSMEISGRVWDYWYRIQGDSDIEQWANAEFITPFPLRIEPFRESPRLYVRPDPTAPVSARWDGLLAPDEMGYAELVERTAQEHPLTPSGRPDYWYRIAEQYESGGKKWDIPGGGRWIHGSEVNVLLGDRARAAWMARYPVPSMPGVSFDRDRVLSSLGAPRQIINLDSPPLFPGGPPNQTYVYDGFQITFDQWVLLLEITGPQIDTMYGLRVGSRGSDVAQLLGDSGESKVGELSYSFGDRESTFRLRFVVEDGVVVRVVWRHSSTL